MKLLAQNIKSLRQNAGMSQSMLSKHLHVTQGAVSQWQHGITQPDMQQLVSMSKLFDVSLDQLTGGAQQVGKESITVSDQRKAAKQIIEKLPQLTDDQLYELRGYIAGKFGK